MYRICKKCVMDNISDNDITFDEKGICNFCYEYEYKFKKRVLPLEESEYQLATLIEKIKKTKKTNKYDCIIGVSGGVDSTYTALKVKEYGLNPLAVHLDNGWNSELAIHNIQKILDTLDIDLYTHVIDWSEFKNLQLSFLYSSTPDGEIPTDHAISAILYQIANEYGIKYIVSGNNFITEGIMPLKWAYGHLDWEYIKSIHKEFGSSKIKTFPFLSLSKLFWYVVIKRIKIFSILNYLDYNKEIAMNEIKTKLDWKYYGGKHYESNYTKFYQGYILPKKFKIDKRKLHLSALVLSNQLNREEALLVLQEPIYPEGELERDIEYFKKKLNLSGKEFENILSMEPKTFFDYQNNHKILSFLRRLVSFLRHKKLFYN